jgi:hypothetical protein
VLDKIGRGGADAITAWAEATPEENREAAFYRASKALAEIDATEAAAWYETHMEEEWAASALQSIARTWVASEDRAALFEWLARLPADARRDEAIRVSFSKWWQIDRDEADAWITSVELSPGLDPALAFYARQVSRSDPRGAVEWANQIQDSKLRKKAILPILRAWYRQEPEAARDWLMENETNASEALRRLILKRPDNMT